MIRTEHILDSWKSIREDTIAAVQEFPADEFGFRITPEMQSFGEIARHIVIAGEGITGMMLAGETDFTAPDFRPRMLQKFGTVPENAGAVELIDALRSSLDRRLAELAAKPAEFFSGMITRFDGQRLTRLEMVQFTKEHELTHRAQLFMCLRLKGIVPVTTRRRAARSGK